MDWNWKVIRTKAEYNKAIKRTMAIPFPCGSEASLRSNTMSAILSAQLISTRGSKSGNRRRRMPCLDYRVQQIEIARQKRTAGVSIADRRHGV